MCEVFSIGKQCLYRYAMISKIVFRQNYSVWCDLEQ